MSKILIVMLTLTLVLVSCNKQETKIEKIEPDITTTDIPMIHTKISVVEIEPVGKSIPEKEGIVQIKSSSFDNYHLGTGFFIEHNNNKYLVTAAHNIGTAHIISVFRGDGAVKIRILKQYINKKVDIALFKVETKEKCFELDDSAVFAKTLELHEKYESIKAEVYGYPTQWHFRKTEGFVYHSILSGINLNGDILICTSNCDNGMSGGPWINKKNGKIIAITILKLFETVTGGIPVETIIKEINNMEKK